MWVVLLDGVMGASGRAARGILTRGAEMGPYPVLGRRIDAGRPRNLRSAAEASCSKS